MKSAILPQRPHFALMKLTDVISFYHLQMPRWLFCDARYKTLSLEAKVAYTFLLNRFQLSRMNGWVNDAGEVYIVFTREVLSRALGVSYRKAIECFQELAQAALIWERRLGRGCPNQIYLAAVRLSDRSAASHDCAPFTDRSADSAYQEQSPQEERRVESAHLEGGKNCENGTSGNAGTAPLDLPDPHTSYIEKNQTEQNSLSPSPDDDTELQEILKKCELPLFQPELAGLFEHAVTRLYYSDNLRVDDALLPQKVIRRTLHALDGSILQLVERKLHSNTERRVRKGLVYTMVVIINTVWESQADIELDPDLNVSLCTIRAPAGEVCI